MSSKRPKCTVGVLENVLRSLPLVDAGVVPGVVVAATPLAPLDSLPLAWRRADGDDASGMGVASSLARARRQRAFIRAFGATSRRRQYAPNRGKTRA